MVFHKTLAKACFYKNFNVVLFFMKLLKNSGGVPMSEIAEAKQISSTHQPKSHLQIGPTEKFSEAGLEGDIRP